MFKPYYGYKHWCWPHDEAAIEIGYLQVDAHDSFCVGHRSRYLQWVGAGNWVGAFINWSPRLIAIESQSITDQGVHTRSDT
jgi:hypothetical protein